MTPALLLVSVLGPALGLVAAARSIGGPRTTPSEDRPWLVLGAAASLLSLLGLGITLALGGGDAREVAGGALRIDPLGVLVAATVATVGLMVAAYAHRNLRGDPRAGRFEAAAGVLLSAALLTTVAGRLSVLVLGWLVTSAAVAALVGFRGDPAARAAAHRARTHLMVGDAALLGALGLMAATVGDLDLGSAQPQADDLLGTTLVAGGIEVSAAAVAALLLMVAALARAAQLPFGAWLPGTLAAPTPVSALLHAGVVNAGGFLLVRTGAVLGVAPVAAWVLAAVAITTVATAAGAALLRSDVKGSLAVSTSAQMGFMLLTVAAGAPVAAMSHLVGHALYKATRFLGAGESITAAVRERRGLPRGSTVSGIARASMALGVAVVAMGAAALTVPGLVQSTDGQMLAIATGVTVLSAGWGLTAVPRARLLRVAASGAVGLAAAVVAYALVARGLELALDSFVVHDAPAAVPVGAALGGLALLGASLAAIARTPGGRAWLVANLGAAPAPRIVAVARPRRSPSAPARPRALGPRTLEEAW